MPMLYRDARPLCGHACELILVDDTLLKIEPMKVQIRYRYIMIQTSLNFAKRLQGL